MESFTKAWEVTGWHHNGEAFCASCSVTYLEGRDLMATEPAPIFASDEHRLTCGMCSARIGGFTPWRIFGRGGK